MWSLTRYFPATKDGKQIYTRKLYQTYKAARQQAGKHEKSYPDLWLDDSSNLIWNITQEKYASNVTTLT